MVTPKPGEMVYEAISAGHGAEPVRIDHVLEALPTVSSSPQRFSVLLRNDLIRNIYWSDKFKAWLTEAPVRLPPPPPPPVKAPSPDQSELFDDLLLNRPVDDEPSAPPPPPDPDFDFGGGGGFSGGGASSDF